MSLWNLPLLIVCAFYFKLQQLTNLPTFLPSSSCWMTESSYGMVFIVPVCISMLLNLLFLCNIVRVVLLKMRAPAGPQGSGPSRTILQAFRYGNFFCFCFCSVFIRASLTWSWSNFIVMIICSVLCA